MERQDQNEIDLSHVFRVILKRLWIVIVATVAAAIVGGVFGYVRYHDKNYYGTTITYDVSIVSYVDGNQQNGTNYSYTDKHMTRMTELLSEDLFMEELMSGIDGAPKRDEAGFGAYVSALKSALHFSYNEENFNGLYVTIRVLNNEKFANTLLKRVEEEVPLYVQEHMIIPTSGDTTKYQTTCEEQSIATIGLMNGGQTRREAVKFALILGAAAFVISCIAVVIADSTDKRLRNYEKFSERYGITVLGVIPRLNENTETEVQK
ncbi:MAG: hypothetical protein IJY62_04640 [Clostridia bacterium]|nr:hypothetical protein [Clostridia bacterium]